MAYIPRQTGMALLAALILVMTITLIMSNIFYRHQINVSQTALSLHSNQAILLALSGESWARQLLDEDTNGSDHFEELWAQAIPALPVDGGLLNGCISDLQGRFNLNNFASINSAQLKTAFSMDKASLPKIWNYLLDLQEIPTFSGRTEAIIDWVDTDFAPINSYGAERDDYASFMPPRMVGDGLMVEPNELAAVVGYEVFEVQKLMPWITALPSKTTPININTASDELLLALGGDYDLQFRDFVAANRPFDDINRFYDDLDIELGFALNVGGIKSKDRWSNTLVDVKSEYFQLYIEVLLGEARIEVNSIIDRSGGDSVIISRNLTTVPVSLSKESDSTLFEKLETSASLGSGDDMEDIAEDMMEDQQIQPACLMIEA